MWNLKILGIMKIALRTLEKLNMNKTVFKLSFIFILLVCFIGIKAQSLSVVSYDAVVAGDAALSNALYARATLKNISMQTVNVKLKRIDDNYTALTDNNALCWGVCQLPSASVSSISIAIPAGGIDSIHFTGHVFPDMDGIPAEGDITYVFFDEQNTIDSVAFTVHYQVDQTLPVQEKPEKQLFHLYPNPTTDFLNLDFDIDYSRSFTFRIYSIIGGLVLQQELSGLQNRNTIELSDLRKGLYLYTIQEENRILKTGNITLE
jgi:hypothetical protein